MDFGWGGRPSPSGWRIGSEAQSTSVTFAARVIERARTLLGPAMPFVADCNHVHTPGDIQASLARWQDD